MYRCILLKPLWPTNNLLEKYIRRTNCLDLMWEGTYSEEALQKLQFAEYELVFASLPFYAQGIDEGILTELRKQSALILSAVYPESLYSGYHLEPMAFLNEPISVAKFQSAIEIFLAYTKY